MPIASLHSNPRVKTEDIPLEKLATSKALTEQQKTEEAARQFEAMLVRQILTEAQKPMFKSKFAATGVSNDIYQDMMVNQLADKISSSRSLGLAQELGKQFTPQSQKVPNGSTDAKSAPPQIRNLRYDKAATGTL